MKLIAHVKHAKNYIFTPQHESFIAVSHTFPYATRLAASTTESFVTPITDVAVTARNPDILSILSQASDWLTNQRNELIDQELDETDGNQGFLEQIDRELDDLEMQIYWYGSPRLRFKKTVEVLRQSDVEIEHCRKLLKKNGSPRSSSKSAAI